MDIPQKYLLTLDEVAEVLGVSWDTARRLVRFEGLPAVRIGRQIKVNAASLQEWINKHKVPEGK